MVSITSSSEDQAVTGSESVPCLHAIHTAIGGQERVGSRPGVAPIMRGGGNCIGWSFDDLSEERDAQGIACQACEVGGGSIVWAISVKGQAIGIAVVGLKQV